MTKVLVFDLDDTLFLEKTFVLSGFCAVSDWLRMEIGINGFYDICLKIYQSGSRGTIFNMALEQLNIKYDINFIGKMLQVYRSHKPKISLLSDAEEIINYFFKTNPLSIITDGYYDTQRNKVAALDIGRLFDFIVYSDSNGRESWKPSAWPYLEIMKFYGKSGYDYIYIADNALKDFITAKKLGWQTVHIQRVEGEHSSKKVSEEYEADCKINSLLELKKIII